MGWKNKEAHRAYNKKWYAENKERTAAAHVAWAKANPGKMRQYQRNSQARNKDKRRASSQRRYWERGGKDAQRKKLLMEL